MLVPPFPRTATGSQGIMSRPAMDPDQRETALRTLLRFRRLGLTLRRAAAVAGVHAATVCRWQRSDPDLHEALAEAAAEARMRRQPDAERERVPWHRACPL